MMLSDVYLSICRVHRVENRETYRKTKIGTEVAHVTRDSDTTFKVKRSKVKVTRPLCSPPCWRVRRLQRWAWERVDRGKLLLYVVGGARRFGAHGGEVRGKSWRPPAHSLLLLSLFPVSLPCHLWFIRGAWLWTIASFKRCVVVLPSYQVQVYILLLLC